MEVKVLVTQFEQLDTSFDSDLLLKKRVEHHINLVLDVLDQEWEAVHEWDLQLVTKVRVLECVD